MLLRYSANDLEIISRNFYQATSVNLSILDERFMPLQYHSNITNNRYCYCIQRTLGGKEACDLSDEKLLLKCQQNRKTEKSPCHAGLVDITVPIIHENVIIGYIILGQIRHKHNTPSFQAIADELRLDAEELERAYMSLPVFDDSKIESVVGLATMLAKHILVENMVQLQKNPKVDAILSYINENLDQPLTIAQISRDTNTSTSTLYHLFQVHYGITIKEYINRRRIEKAKQLLLTSDKSMEDIAIQSGFSDPSYFSRVFKKENGISPSAFRKPLQK